MTAIAQSIWQPLSRSKARLRLLCFPYAGGGANVFRGWERELGEDIELASVQLPGREWRRSEPPFRRMDQLVDHLLPEILVWLDDPRPGLFFGYSMGAALAFAVATRLHHTGKVMPHALFAAACRAPQLLERMSQIFKLNDDEFVAAIQRIGGLPDIVMAEPELLQLALPALRADFEVLGTYMWQGCEPLPCPVTVYGGSEDPLATRAELAQWRERTCSDFQMRLFSGGHFFINDARTQLQKTLLADLALVQARTV